MFNISFVFSNYTILAVGLSGAVQNNTFGSGKFNYTYTPSSTAANTTAVTPAADSVSSVTHGSGVNSGTGGAHANANNGIPRSPRALNSTSKKLSFTTGSSKTNATVGATGGDLLSSPRAAGVQVSAGLKRTNSSHQHVRWFIDQFLFEYIFFCNNLFRFRSSFL